MCLLSISVVWRWHCHYKLVYSPMEDRCPVDHKKSESCPVDHGKAESCPVDHGKQDSCPVDHSKNGAESCPVDHGSAASSNNPLYNTNANDFVFDQSRTADQKANLSVKRATSNIPKGDFTPEHQPKATEKWVYPSEQQYYNAMKRKGYNPSEADIPAVLFIHNHVNEQGWSKVKEWEAYSGFSNPKLKKFMGKPTQLSPKARLLNMIGYSKPFDRHDWIVERPDGQEVRYVIDFYGGARNINPSKPQPVSIYLDVRPAADTVSAIVARLSFSWRQRFQPFSLPKWCLMGSPFFKAVHERSEKNGNL